LPSTLTIPMSELTDGKAIRVASDAGPLLIFRDGERVTAHSAKCTHFGISMKPPASGAVVTCGFHGAQYSLYDGINTRRPLSKTWQGDIPLGIGKVAALIVPQGKCKALQSYPVTIDGDNIRINLP
jgi:nitrite reductase/ring-hydroxylating ferredoxin subunit